MCVWAEARGEPALGKLAVAWVIRNRASRRNTDYRREILRPWQFSSFNADDPNRAKMLNAHVTSAIAWAECDVVCELFESGTTMDPTLGATHYYVTKMSNPPKWGRGSDTWVETAEIGAHVFGRADG
jgi:spore germination cell wall hydrolase CwlJ-like protein